MRTDVVRVSDQYPGFSPEDTSALSDVVAGAYLAGFIPGTLRFSRVILGAGYRLVAPALPEYEPRVEFPDRMHYFVIGAAEDRPDRFGWQCSCTTRSRHTYLEPVSAFGNALSHVPAGEGWRAKGETRGG